MANKKVNLIISLKDNVSEKAKGIGSRMKAMGVSFQAAAKVGIAAFAAVGAGLVKLATSFAEQETVNNRLKASFDAAGESGDEALVKWAAWATEIQRVTTLGDEEIMNLISLGKNMGIANEQMAEATKGAIGLSKAFGIDMTASMKMVALALEGDYNMLQRYIPALKGANSEAEKAAIVNAAMANGFKLAEAELDTMAGQMEALKGVWGDTMQELGDGVYGEGGAKNGLEDLKQSLINLSESGAIADIGDQFGAVVSRWLTGLSQIAEGFINLQQKIGDFKAALTATKNPFKIKGAMESAEASRNQVKEDRAFEKALAKRQQAQADLIESEKRARLETEKAVADKAKELAKEASDGKATTKATAEVAKEAVKEATTTAADPLAGEGKGVTESVNELFSSLSEGRSFEGALEALRQVTDASQGEAMPKIVTLLEDQNRILTDRLGGVK